MSQTLKAIYRVASFITQTPCNLPDGAGVEITVRAPNLIPPKVADPEERRRLTDELIQNMLDNPIPENAPRATVNATFNYGPENQQRVRLDLLRVAGQWKINGADCVE